MNPFSLGYATWMLIVIVMTQISNTWSRTAMSQFFAYGIPGKKLQAEYAMQVAFTINGKHTLTQDTYGIYAGLMYSLAYCPMLLFVNPLTESWNRKLTIGITCTCWGICSCLHALTLNIYVLYLLIFLIGFFQSMAGPMTYTLITDFFSPKYRVKAFFAFSVLQQLGDPFKFMTQNLITAFGWKKAWFFVGGFGIMAGLLTLLTLTEPKRKEISIPITDEDEDS